MKLLISILVFILTLAATFCVGVFISWDFDLSNWSPLGRYMAAAFGLIFAVLAAVKAWDEME